MSTGLEQLLRGGMERLTQDVRLSPGLARKAQRHRQKRRMTTLAVAAAGTVTVVTAGALAAAGAAGAPGPARSTQIRMAAYVVSRVEKALAATSQDNLLSYTRKVYPPGWTVQPVGPALILGTFTRGASGSPWTVGYSLSWMYQGSVHLSAFTATGQRVFDESITVRNGQPATRVVIYRNDTWWAANGATAQVGPQPGPSGCSPDVELQSGPGNGWPAFIRHQLSCGEYTVVGRQQVDGVDAIKLSGNHGLQTLWVDPATYLPVRVIMGPAQGQSQADFQWIPPTPANLANLAVPVPAGFTRVPAP